MFPSDYDAIIDKINVIHPAKYAKTRNYLNGDITYLSPYISRGVISTKQIMDAILKNCYKNGIFTLGKISGNKIYPERITSDYFIYTIPQHVYLYTYPLFITNNELLESTIHPENSRNHINASKHYKQLVENSL
jgi:deoxyribodipyrimidine photolyase